MVNINNTVANSCYSSELNWKMLGNNDNKWQGTHRVKLLNIGDYIRNRGAVSIWEGHAIIKRYFLFVRDLFYDQQLEQPNIPHFECFKTTKMQWQVLIIIEAWQDYNVLAISN